MLDKKIQDLKIREEGQIYVACNLSEVVVCEREGKLVLNVLGTEYSFLDVGLESLCKFIKVPYRYLENLPIKLQIKNLSNGLAVPKDVKISINGNGYIRGVCSKKYQTPLLSEQLEGVVNSLFLKYDLEFYKIFEEKLYLIISFPKFSYEKYKPALSF